MDSRGLAAGGGSTGCPARPESGRAGVPRASARRRLGDQDAVDDVDDPVGRAHVGGDDLRPVHEHVAAADADPHALAVERLDRRALDDALGGEPA